MRILYCNKYNFPFSGTESYLFAVMKLVRAHGHEAALFSMVDARGEPTPYDRHFIPHIDFKAEDLGVAQRVKHAAHAIYSTDARKRLREMIAEFKPDVAHVRNIYHHLSPSILWELKAQKIPVIYHLNDFKLLCPTYNLTAHGRPCEKCSGGKFWHAVTEGCYAGSRASASVLAAEAYAHRWLKTYEECVDRFLAPSQFVKDKLVENGWDAEKIDVLAHFQDATPKLKPPISSHSALYFGRLSPEKGLVELLQAAQRLPQMRLRIAGDGPQRAELERLAGDLGLRNAEFLGHVSGAELEREITASAFTIFPSRVYETLGKSILESYAFGRPVIASDLGSRRELVGEGKTGLLYPPGDVAKLAEAMELLARCPQVATAMGWTAHELVRTQYAPEQHYRELNNLYEFVQARKAPKVRVAFIGGRGVASKYSGIESYYEEVGERLAGMGHEVTVYCRSYFTPHAEAYKGMRLVRLPAWRSKHLETFSHTLLSTVHAMFSRCEIVHYHALGPALFSFLPRLMGKKTIVTVQGLDWQRKKWGKFAARVLQLGEQASAKLPNETMVVSQALQKHYENRYRTKATYVPNGTTIRAQRRASQMVKWGVEPKKYILFLGRFSPEKNCHLLVQAFERIETDVKLVMAGGASYTDAYARELRTHEGPNIRLLNWVAGAELEELLTNALLFVLPSDMEGLSLALLDAMGAGVCVLTSDIPENCEVVRDAGFTFKQGDVDDLKQMLRLLLSHPAMREAAADAARKRVNERYLWGEIAGQIEQSYLKLTKRNSPRRLVTINQHESPDFWSDRAAG